MDNQQAINLLKDLEKNLDDYCGLNDEGKTAFHMAIEALNCSEIPNNSDTISRQAVTKFLNDWLSCLFENCHKQSASDLKMIIKDFKNLPSVQPDDDRLERCRLERCRFEYANACKIVTHPTPDTTKKDIADAYAVVRALNPIFGEEGF